MKNTPQERKYIADHYRNIRKILKGSLPEYVDTEFETWYLSEHENECWEAIKLLLWVAFIGGIIYAVYMVFSMPGGFGWM